MKTIVLAENDELVRELLGEILTVLGFTWTQVSTAEYVLTILRNTRPDLLLLNMEMPGAQALVEQLKDDSVLHGLPVVGITAEDQECLPEHMDGLLVKPFSVSAIREQLASCLGQSGAPLKSQSIGRVSLGDEPC